MSRALRYCCLVTLAFPLAGCSVHPLPENFPLNFPRASTFDIVQKVRCEAKAGLERFKNSRRPEHIKLIIDSTSIGYDFKLVMTENNDATGGQLSFARLPSNPASDGSLNIDLTGQARKQRMNTRTFRLVEDLADVAKADCSAEALRANLVYPIAGRLHVDDVVYTYVRLERMTDFDDDSVEQGDIAEPTPDPANPRNRSGVFSEQLAFRTSLKLGATPTLTVSAVAGSFRLTKASVNAQIKRVDAHDVIIALAQDPELHKKEAAVQQRNAYLGRSASGASARRIVARGAAGAVEERVVVNKVIRAAKLETRLAQANAAARNNVYLELARLRNLSDDEQERPKFLGKQLLKFLRPPDETGPGD
jgi:hypothetical protein